jgi:hypothetical protein
MPTPAALQPPPPARLVDGHQLGLRRQQVGLEPRQAAAHGVLHGAAAAAAAAQPRPQCAERQRRHSQCQ